jgi:hypothetical protein
LGQCGYFYDGDSFSSSELFLGSGFRIGQGFFRFRWASM